MAVGVIPAAANDRVGRHDLPQKEIGARRVAAVMADLEHRCGKRLVAVDHVVFGRPFRVAGEQKRRLPVGDPGDEGEIVHIVVNAQRRVKLDLRAPKREALPRLRHGDSDVFRIGRAFHRFKRLAFKFIHRRIQRLHRKGADDVRQAADVIRVRVGADHGVDGGNMQRVLQIIDQLCAALRHPAVDDERFPVANHNRRIPLPDIHEVHGEPGARQPPEAVGRKARRQQRQRQQRDQQRAQSGVSLLFFRFHAVFPSPCDAFSLSPGGSFGKRLRICDETVTSERNFMEFRNIYLADPQRIG